MRGLTAVLLCGALAGCGDPVGQELARLDAARRRWEGAAIRTYQYDLVYASGRLLFLEVRIVVRDGAFQTAVNLGDGTAADTAPIAPLLTVDAAFASIRDALAREPTTFTARYHPQLGYPMEVAIDADVDGPGFTIASSTGSYERISRYCSASSSFWSEFIG